MTFIVLDTETTNLDKPFCYDCSYVIVNDNWDILEKRSSVVEQTWHNLQLFESAYYKDKRPLYVLAMRKHEAILDKWGYIMQQMKRDITKYEVTDIYAYNSPFDEKVIDFNCDWFKCINPTENIPWHDIRGYVHQFLIDDEYKDYCEQHELFTETGNYSSTAEAVTRYLRKDNSFIEDHTALSDSIIEMEILCECCGRGAELTKDYEVIRSIKRPQTKPFTIKIDGKVIVKDNYIKKYIKDDIYSFTLDHSDEE